MYNLNVAYLDFIFLSMHDEKSTASKNISRIFRFTKKLTIKYIVLKKCEIFVFIY